MRINIIKTVFKKEMTDILRDKKTVFMTIILPIILYPFLIVLFSQVISMAITSIKAKDLNIAFNVQPSAAIMEQIEHTEQGEGQLKVVEVEDYEEALAEEEIMAYVEISDNNYKIYMNSSIDDAQEASMRLEDILETYKNELTEEKIKSLGLSKEEVLEPITYEIINVAKSEEKAGYLLGSILPFILIIGILTGAIYPAIDVMAGEKERGTLETLLTMPISNLEFIMGKYLAVSISAMTAAVFNIISIVASMIFLFFGMSSADAEGVIDFTHFEIGQMIVPFIITFICVCIFAMVIAAVSMCVCSLAKSFKEAQNATTPITLIVMIMSYVSMIPNVELNNTTAIIPVVNVVLLIKSVLNFKASVGLMAIVLMANIAFVILVVIILSKLFKSEEILFGSSREFSFLNRRSDIKEGTMPTISDGLILFCIGLLVLLYIGSYIQTKYKIAGVGMTQVLILALPLGFAYYIKSNFKCVFPIKLVKVRTFIGGIMLWMGTYIGVSLISSMMMNAFPQSSEVLQAVNEALYVKDNLIVNLLIVAAMPAIAEELFFRGFLYTSFKQKGHFKLAIILSSILFGMMHIDFIRVIPTGLLGLSFAYMRYTSGSMLMGMVCHFLNNGTAVLCMHNPNGYLAKLLNFVEMDIKQMSGEHLAVLLVSMAALIGAGILLLGKIKEESIVH